MERQLGERFTYRGGVTLEVAEVEDEEMACKGCYLFEKKLCCMEDPDLQCTDDMRSDHTNVIYKEIKNQKI